MSLAGLLQMLGSFDIVTSSDLDRWSCSVFLLSSSVELRQLSALFSL
jgi:hypothetical protein